MALLDDEAALGELDRVHAVDDVVDLVDLEVLHEVVVEQRRLEQLLGALALVVLDELDASVLDRVVAGGGRLGRDGHTLRLERVLMRRRHRVVLLLRLAAHHKLDRCCSAATVVVVVVGC